MPVADSLEDVLARNEQDERRRALRALLARPLLAADDDAFTLVRRHAEWLRAWLAREAGWALQVEADFARLYKRAGDHADPTRAAPPGHRRSHSPPFDRRRYVLLCLALAELERGEGQLTLGRLGAAVVDAAADPAFTRAGLRFTLEGRDDRRDLVAVVRLLLELGVLRRVAGAEEEYVGQERDVLYDVDRRVLAALLVTSRGPSLVPATGLDTDGRIAAVTATCAPVGEARGQALRRRLTRRLLDDPVLYRDELTAEERVYLARQRTALLQRIEEATGLVAEVRAEGLALVDPGGDLTDEPLPAEGTEGHLTLLLAEHLAHADGPVARAELEDWVRIWTAEYGRYWKKAARDDGAEFALVEQGLERLCALRLVAVDGDRVVPLPAIGRFKLAPPWCEDGDSSELS